MSDTLITVEWLKRKHPELTDAEAQSLLEYCNAHTIYDILCYGDDLLMRKILFNLIKRLRLICCECGDDIDAKQQDNMSTEINYPLCEDCYNGK